MADSEKKPEKVEQLPLEVRLQLERMEMQQAIDEGNNHGKLREECINRALRASGKVQLLTELIAEQKRVAEAVKTVASKLGKPDAKEDSKDATGKPTE